jgi:hypothetical protein
MMQLFRPLAVLGLFLTATLSAHGTPTQVVGGSQGFEAIDTSFEAWLKSTISAGREPSLAIELHNDGGGLLHISRPPIPRLAGHLARMALFEQLLRDNTWFTEGSTNTAFRNSGTLGDGWLERFGIDAVVHELNCNWIEGVHERPTAQHWIEYGEKLALVLREYFVRM